MADGIRLWEFSVLEFVLLVDNEVAYLRAGAIAFSLFVRRARKLGVMGHY